jgi:mRNA (2'-O-methyladenosine-N6-)-methyltransferase
MLKNAGQLFDVIVMDPPWQLAFSNPTRGVTIKYQTMSDKQILNMPIHKLQTKGFMLIWIVNSKFYLCLELLKKHGYTYVDDVTWVKQTTHSKVFKSHGYYLQHSKETCIIGYKGDDLQTVQERVSTL